MLPIRKDETPNYQRYSIVTRWTVINGEQIAQYGIEQISFDENGRTLTTTINDISDDRIVVINLVKQLELEDVPAVALQDIVEDYVAELAMTV